MRSKTRDELLYLAKKMSDEFEIEKAINSNEFLEWAIDLSEEIGLEIGRQTLVKYEAELKRLCKSIEDDKAIEMKKVIETIEVAEKPRLKMSIHFYEDGTFKVEKFKKEEEQLRFPEYTMFAQAEDGYLILKGKYKGRYIDEINELAGFGGAKQGWARWCLQNDNNLTDDDRELFNKILSNKL